MWEESVLLTLLGGRMGSDEWCTSRYLDNIFLEISISTFQVVILFEINDENILYVSCSLLDKHKSKIKKERVILPKLEKIWFAILLMQKFVPTAIFCKGYNESPFCNQAQTKIVIKSLTKVNQSYRTNILTSSLAFSALRIS